MRPGRHRCLLSKVRGGSRSLEVGTKAFTHGGECDYDRVLALMGRINAAGIKIIKTENLYNFEGLPGYSLAQGQ
ncbi:MAG: hypothetical protein NXI32_24255 [bacterium]|nr:hypothetical protein [bacterium]